MLATKVSMLALGALTFSLSFAAPHAVPDGTQHECETIIVGDATAGYSYTCDYNNPCPDQDPTCLKVESTVGGVTVATCACADGTWTTCCSMNWVDDGGQTGYLLVGDCNPPAVACDTGVCSEVPIPTPIGRPPRQTAECVVDS